MKILNLLRNFLILTSLLFSSINYAASFSCERNNLSNLERDICADRLISHTDEIMAVSYRFLLNQCNGYVDVVKIKADQRSWLNETQQLFNKSSNKDKLLEQQYANRNQQLNQQIDICGEKNNSIVALKTKIVHDESLEHTLPLFESKSEKISQNINEKLGSSLVLKSREQQNKNPDDRGSSNTFEDFSITYYDGKILGLTVTAEGCGAYCESYDTYYIFDLRTGKNSTNQDFFTAQGSKEIAERLKQKRIKRAQEIIKNLDKKTDPDEMRTYQDCIKEWPTDDAYLWETELTKDKKLRFIAPSCSAHVNRPHDSLDHLDEKMSFLELKPYFNSYGKNLFIATDNDFKSSR